VCVAVARHPDELLMRSLAAEWEGVRQSQNRIVAPGDHAQLQTYS
jgi:hypothetical protein